jgi:hypothetical protein
LQSTLLFKFEGDVAVLIHGSAAPSDADWRTYLAALLEHRDTLQAVLVVSDGAGPNAAQRSKINGLVGSIDREIPTAVVTHSGIARSIVTVMHWFNRGIQAFGPDQLSMAFDYLGIAADRRETIKRAIVTMRVSLAVSPEDASGAMDLVDTIAKLDELVTHRLPVLRSRFSNTRPRRP